MVTRPSAAQAGWRLSEYSIVAWSDELAGGDGEPVPVVANLFAGTLARSSVLEQALLHSLDRMPATHPILERFERLGWIVDFDERARIDEMARAAADEPPTTLTLMVCTTMACNFDCPYCMQHRGKVKMAEETQDQVAALVDRLLATSCAKELRIDWFGGEPLLAADVMERLYPLLKGVCTKHGAGIYSHVVTNGYLLDRESIRLLGSCHTKLVRVTLDGARETHDKTRRLAGGGGTYDRLMENISRPMPWPIEIRMNVHDGNRGEADAVQRELARIAEATGNRFLFRPSEVFDTEASRGREGVPDLLELEGLRAVSLNRMHMGLHGAAGTHCPGQNPYDVCVDDQGGLHACQATLSEPELAFGDARTWDPARPLETAKRPDALKWFKHDSLAVNIPECRACRWLPLCMGGCAFVRSTGRRDCMPWKDDPEGFVLAQYARLGEKRRDARLTPQMVGRAAAPLLERYGIQRAWVHGSVALGTAHAGSDVDLIVEMPPGKYLGRNLFNLRKELREAFGRKVDLHTPPNDYSDPSVAAFIERHKVLVYERHEADEDRKSMKSRFAARVQPCSKAHDRKQYSDRGRKEL